VKRTRVASAFPDVGHKMLFLYDYGNDWRFVVEVIGLGQTAAKIRYPKVLKKVGKAPEQYGSWDEDGDEEDETRCLQHGFEPSNRLVPNGHHPQGASACRYERSHPPRPYVFRCSQAVRRARCSRL
jgi:hypothetical protein